MKQLFTSKTCEHPTPKDFYAKLNDEFNFTLDPCATDLNHKCNKYYTMKDDGLKQNWDNERIFCNPPYGREIGKWMKKLSETDAPVRVALVPARTDTKWFHEHVLGKAEIRFVKGRLKFGDAKNSAPFPSIVIVYNNNASHV